VDSREHLKGLINSSNWNMSVILDRANINRTFERIRRLIIEGEDLYPIQLNFGSKVFDGNDFEGHILVDNISPKDIEDGTIDVVVPTLMDVYARYTPMAIDRITPFSEMGDRRFKARFDDNNKYSIQSTHLPHYHQEYIRITGGGGVHRSTMFLRKLHGLNSYETKWFFNNLKDTIDRFYFVTIIRIPLFGVRYYQGIVKYGKPTIFEKKLNKDSIVKLISSDD